MEYVIILRWGKYKKTYPATEAAGMGEALELAKERFPMKTYEWDEISVREATERDSK